MNSQKIDRRQLLKLGISSAVLATIPLNNIVLADDVTGRLLEFVSGSDLPVDDKRTGVLSDLQFKTLTSLCRFVDQTWELHAELDQYFNQLQGDLVLKASQEPSYLTEYEHAIELYELVFRDSENAEQVWPNLLFSAFKVDNFAGTKLGRARRLVFAEIIAHQIPISGAFKSFGLSNYTGYFGGSYLSPTSYKRGVL